MNGKSICSTMVALGRLDVDRICLHVCTEMRENVIHSCLPLNSMYTNTHLLCKPQQHIKKSWFELNDHKFYSENNDIHSSVKTVKESFLIYWMPSWFTQKVCTLFSSGVFCPPCGFMNRPSLVWAGPKVHPLGEADQNDKKVSKGRVLLRKLLIIH